MMMVVTVIKMFRRTRNGGGFAALSSASAFYKMPTLIIIIIIIVIIMYHCHDNDDDVHLDCCASMFSCPRHILVSAGKEEKLNFRLSSSLILILSSILINSSFWELYLHFQYTLTQLLQKGLPLSLAGR